MNELPKRKQIRITEYDYSQNGYYFITVCTKDRENIFYDIPTTKININDNDDYVVGATIGRLNENGKIVKNAIEKIHDKYSYCYVDKYVIMPNHIHMILVIDKPEQKNETTGNGRPMVGNGRPMVAPTVQFPEISVTTTEKTKPYGQTQNKIVGAVNDRPDAEINYPTISRIMKQFKGYVSKQIGYTCWQKSFYEHIIRNDREYQKIYEYIENNPVKWEEDKYYNSI